MPIEQENFVRYHEEKAVDSFTIRFNEAERKSFEEDKKILEQSKDSTALKQLARIGSIVIHDSQMSAILGVVFSNKRKNQRAGIIEFE